MFRRSLLIFALGLVPAVGLFATATAPSARAGDAPARTKVTLTRFIDPKDDDDDADLDAQVELQVRADLLEIEVQSLREHIKGLTSRLLELSIDGKADSAQDGRRLEEHLAVSKKAYLAKSKELAHVHRELEELEAACCEEESEESTSTDRAREVLEGVEALIRALRK